MSKIGILVADDHTSLDVWVQSTTGESYARLQLATEDQIIALKTRLRDAVTPFLASLPPTGSPAKPLNTISDAFLNHGVPTAELD